MGEMAQTSPDEFVRTLAAAAAAVRLYPPTSEIPAQAIARFVSVSESVTKTSGGPVRLMIEPKGFRSGETILAEGQAQVSAFAEVLYAHQAGQLITTPGLTAEEGVSFLRCACSDPSGVREEGGLQNVIAAAGVTHLAIVEMTVRASTEEGLAGLDLTSAPLDAIGSGTVRAAATWARTAAAGEGRDEVVEAIGGMAPAARELATDRVAEALLHLDEQTRVAVLAAAMRQDSTGKTMSGIFSVVARMKPATLARLLTLAAARAGTDPGSVMAKLTLPPEALRALELLLRPSPRSEAESGVPAAIAPERMAEDAVETEADAESLRDSFATLEERSKAPRALRTAIRLAERSQEAEGVDALADALGRAIAVGAFSAARPAFELVDRLAEEPRLELSIGRVRNAVTQADSLKRGLLSLDSKEDAQNAAEAVNVAGPAGVEDLLDAWVRASEPRRGLLEHTARAVSEQVIIASRRRLRGEDPAEARAVISLLGRLEDRRAVSALSQALDNPVADVRVAAVSALATLDTEDVWAAITSTLTHPDESTARAALGAIRSHGKRGAVPAMLAILQLHDRSTRNHVMKREIIEDIGRMRASEALPVLKRLASRRMVFGSKARELRDAARNAVTRLQTTQEADARKVDQ